MTNGGTFSAPHLHVIARELLMAVGAPEHIANNVARILIGSDLAGHDSHGVIVLPQRVDQATDGTVDPAAEPRVVEVTSATLTIDGNKGYGLHAARVAMDLAIEKAEESNVFGVRRQREAVSEGLIEGP